MCQKKKNVSKTILIDMLYIICALVHDVDKMIARYTPEGEAKRMKG